MSPERVRYPYANPTSARMNVAFVAWGWAGWIWAAACWLVYVLFTYPTAAAVYRGEIGPLSPIKWIVQSVLYSFVFLPPLVAALYAGWVFFVVLRLTADEITVGRWFGARRVTYRSRGITTWRFVNRRSQDVPEAKSASRLRIDFADGSWVRVSRYGWNFRRLEPWLRRWAPAAARPVWRLPDDQPATYAFVVRDVRAILFGLVGWVIFWLVTTCSALLILVPRPNPPSSGDIIHYAVMLIGSLIAGPFIAHATLKEIRVDAPRIHVKRWFGLIHRTYREGDIKWWRVSLDPNPPWWREAREASLVLSFANGPKLIVQGQAANFHALLEYLRARVAAREEVRRGNERRRAVA